MARESGSTTVTWSKSPCASSTSHLSSTPAMLLSGEGALTDNFNVVDATQRDSCAVGHAWNRSATTRTSSRCGLGFQREVNELRVHGARRQARADDAAGILQVRTQSAARSLALRVQSSAGRGRHRRFRSRHAAHAKRSNQPADVMRLLLRHPYFWLVLGWIFVIAGGCRESCASAATAANGHQR